MNLSIFFKQGKRNKNFRKNDLETEDLKNTKSSKLKHNSPEEKQTKTRKFLPSSFWPDSKSCKYFRYQSPSIEVNPNQAFLNSSSTNPSSITITKNISINATPSLIQSTDQTYRLPIIIYSAMCYTDFIKQLVQILDDTTTHSLQKVVLLVFQ